MPVAYVDSSAIVAVRFGEGDAAALADRLDGFELLSSNLLEAEFRAAHAREEQPFEGSLLNGILWVFPARALTAEIARVLEAGYLKGADAWHLAVALSIVEEPAEIAFLTLDERQKEVAADLGFRT